MTDGQHETHQSKSPLPAYVPTAFETAQFQKAFETYGSSLSLYVQLTVALIAANATLLVYAIRERLAGVLIIGPVFPGVIAYMYAKFRRLALAPLYTAIHIEQRAGGPARDWLASTHLAMVMSPQYVRQLEDIAALDDADERIRRLKAMPPPILAPGEELGLVVLVILAAVQIVLAVVLAQAFHWRFL